VSDIKRNKYKFKQHAGSFDVSKTEEISENNTIKKPHDRKLEEALYQWYVQQHSNGVGMHGV
jgi:hypothetical protein